MTIPQGRSGQSEERELARNLLERPMSRRHLLGRMAGLAATGALTPLIAACAAAATSSPAATATQPAASTGPTSAPATPVPTPESELFIYNWDAYIGATTVSDFEAKYKIKVTYDRFPDESTQMTKLRSDGKGGGYDVTYPVSTEIPALARDGILLKLDHSLIPNSANLAAAWASPPYDPGNTHSMPNYWWTTGFAWDPDKISDKLTDWPDLWTSAYGGHLAMLDDVREVFAAAAFRLGLSPNTTADADLDKILSLLREQKPLVRIWTTNDIADLTSGQVWITHAWSGDWYQMIVDKPKTQYAVPTSGAVRGSDTIVALSGARHPIAAQLWIDYNLDAKVSAANTNFIGYMGPNKAALPLIDAKIVNDPRLNPPDAVQAKLVELDYLAPADLDKYTSRWTTLRA